MPIDRVSWPPEVQHDPYSSLGRGPQDQWRCADRAGHHWTARPGFAHDAIFAENGSPFIELDDESDWGVNRGQYEYGIKRADARDLTHDHEIGPDSASQRLDREWIRVGRDLVNSSHSPDAVPGGSYPPRHGSLLLGDVLDPGPIQIDELARR